MRYMKFADAVIGNQQEIILEFEKLVAELGSTHMMIEDPVDLTGLYSPYCFDTIEGVHDLRSGQCKGALAILKTLLSDEDYKYCWQLYDEKKDKIDQLIAMYEYRCKAYIFFTKQYVKTGTVDTELWMNAETLRENNLSKLNIYHLQTFYNEWRDLMNDKEAYKRLMATSSYWCVEEENNFTEDYQYKCNACGFIIKLKDKPSSSLPKDGYHYCPYCGKSMYIPKEDKS